MSGSRSDRGAHESGPAGTLGEELAAALHDAVREAAERLEAVTAAVYLLSPDGTELRIAMIGGGPPSAFTLLGRMPLDASYASARALADGEVAVLADPDAPREHIPGCTVCPYPYLAAAAPLTAAGVRFGSLTVLRPEGTDDYGPGRRSGLARIAGRLSTALAALHRRGVPVVSPGLPVLVPVRGAESSADADPAGPWGMSGVAGSAGRSLMFPLQRLADLLNRATTMDHVTAAARFCVMAPFQARAMVLSSVAEGRMWVLGHSGDTEGLVRELHGSGLHTGTPAVRAVGGNTLLIADGPGCQATRPGAEPGMWPVTAHLPLVGSRHVVDVPVSGGRHVVGLCTLAYGGPRSFSPAERAVLTMMAGLLGSAVERVELNAKRQVLAEGIQKRMLPSALVEVPGLTTTARYQPATATAEVGGDWYDVIRMPDDRVALVIGDVEGHTMESAAAMGQLRTAVAAYASEGHGPAALLQRTAGLLARLGTESLTTCCVVALDPEDGTAEVALAGHPAPLLRLPDGTVRALDAPANVPLGLPEPGVYRAREHTVGPGSVLLLYSDGLFEAREDEAVTLAEAAGPAGDLPDAGLEDLADRLLGRAPGPRGLRDDAALLLARYEGPDTGRVPRTGHLSIQRRDLRGVRQAREFVHDRLCGWGLADLSDDVELVTSEIVTNALVHAGSDVDVRLRVYADRLRLEVRDSASDPPVPALYSLSDEGCARAEHGRGLFLVDALADTWNTSPNGRGKTVWLEMDIPEGAEGPSRSVE
ncbi:SpoIIE family protein phosphatase [Streptomyces sp. NPDC056160]|uniref:ATP-binding SpoIIE family protein phosphatase n=1 Tax=Streptomyces sp. NPDC056160 TaxID=3345731 RepID=UPI0035D68975